MLNNQKVVQSLLKIVILSGKQGLALRGHRNDHIDWSRRNAQIMATSLNLFAFMQSMIMFLPSI